MSQLTWILLSGLCYGSFAWSVVGVFKVRDKKSSFEYRLLQILTIVFWVFSLYEMFNMDPTVQMSLVGSACSLFCLVIFWWARQTIKGSEPPLVFSDHKPIKLITTGPFKWVTHPFYVCYSICYFGNALVLGNVILIVCAVGLMSLYYLAAKREDRMIMESDLKDDYANYKTQVWFSLVR